MSWYCSDDELTELKQVSWSNPNLPAIPFDIAISGLDQSIRLYFNFIDGYGHDEYLTKDDALKLANVIIRLLKDNEK